jgi:hypothetical protein
MWRGLGGQGPGGHLSYLCWQGQGLGNFVLGVLLGSVALH